MDSKSGKTPANIQNNELYVVSQILFNELKDLRTKNAWNIWQPLNLLINVYPEINSFEQQTQNIKVDLHIICSENYPFSPPKIILENSIGILDDDLKDLKKELDHLAQKNANSQKETIYDLYLHAKDFISSKYNVEEEVQEEKPNTNEENSPTEEVDSTNKAIQDEVQSRLNELQQQRRRTRSSSYSENTGTKTFACDIHKGTEVVIFDCNNWRREIQRGRCIKHAKNDGKIVYMGIDKESGEMVILNEWMLNTETNKDNNILKQITSLEKEMNHLIQLKHDNLARYIKLDHTWESNKLTICVLKEFINGTNCKLLIKQNSTFNYEFIKHLARGVLSALQQLHRNKLVHKNLKPSNVYINNKGVVKISNYGVYKRISDFITSSSNVYKKEVDIFKFGIFILSVLNGYLVSEENVHIPLTIPSEFYDFLNKCLCKEEKDRDTAAQLLKHQFLREPIVHFSPQKEEVVSSKDLLRSIETSERLLTLSKEKSRLTNEFEIIQNLGKGAFGDVIEVRNKLDGGRYAIKRIKLFLKNSPSIDKITREVNCLFKLNHENIVRYYNSWIETTIIRSNDSPSSSTTDSPEKPKKHTTSESLFDDIDALVPYKNKVELSVTYDSKNQLVNPYNSEDDDDDDDDDEDDAEDDDEDDSGDEYQTNYKVASESSDGIQFEESENAASSQSLSSDDAKAASSKPEILQPSDKESPKGERKVQCMYIQMELCAKSTLRNAIDDDLYKNEERVWRLFREIVEGLAHIHQQSVIHRDLKPVNIFLDSADHVKIGDFGLATTINNRQLMDAGIVSANKKLEFMDESKTGAVGTALYVAPELNKGTKVHYNEKVDIYSLGVILFEMSYRPLPTAMERIKLLTDVRSEKIILPEDFLTYGSKKQQLVIRWLLNHNVIKRPTAQEILESDHIPPPVLEERELREMVRHILSDPKLKGYKYLIASCFQQKFSLAQDITYDYDTSAVKRLNSLLLHDFIREKVAKIFQRHGAQNLTTSLLMPVSQYHEEVDSHVKLMTHFGGIVSLPYDLRVPFARYIVWNQINFLRRFSIERAYREKRVFGYIPRELWECAFDIISPTVNLKTDAEIIGIVSEILQNIPRLKNEKCIITLNHALLVKAILNYYGISGDHDKILKALSSFQDKKAVKMQLQTLLADFGMPDNTIETLKNIFFTEVDFSKIDNQFHIITRKKKGEASQLARQAIVELKTIAQYVEYFGVIAKMVVLPALVYKTQIYSGMVCQFAFEAKKKHKHLEVFAIGGRYDSVISHYRDKFVHSGKDMQTKQTGVGVSISLDKLCEAVLSSSPEDPPKLSALDTVVCSLGHKVPLKDKLKVLKLLWENDVRSILMESTRLEEILEKCAELNVRHTVILKENEPNIVRIRTDDRDRVHEKYVNIYELPEMMHKTLKQWSESEFETGQPYQGISRSDSKTSYSEKYSDVVMWLIDRTHKKRCDNLQNLSSSLVAVIKKVVGPIVILNIVIEAEVIRTISGFLQYDSPERFESSFATIVEKHKEHNKKFLKEICDQVYNYINKQPETVIILYSSTDSFYRILYK